MKKTLHKLNTISGILLWVLLFLYFSSGIIFFHRIFGIAWVGLFSFLHLRLLFIPTALTFCYHTSYVFYSLLKRNKKWNKMTQMLLGLYVVLFLVLLILGCIAIYA